MVNILVKISADAGPGTTTDICRYPDPGSTPSTERALNECKGFIQENGTYKMCIWQGRGNRPHCKVDRQKTCINSRTADSVDDLKSGVNAEVQSSITDVVQGNGSIQSIDCNNKYVGQYCSVACNNNADNTANIPRITPYNQDSGTILEESTWLNSEPASNDWGAILEYASQPGINGNITIMPYISDLSSICSTGGTGGGDPNTCAGWGALDGNNCPTGSTVTGGNNCSENPDNSGQCTAAYCCTGDTGGDGSNDCTITPPTNAGLGDSVLKVEP